MREMRPNRELYFILILVLLLFVEMELSDSLLSLFLFFWIDLSKILFVVTIGFFVKDVGELSSKVY